MVTVAFEEAPPTIDLGRVVDSMAWNEEFRKANFDSTKHSANKHFDVGYSFNLRRARTASSKLQMLKAAKDGGVAWTDARKQLVLGV